LRQAAGRLTNIIRVDGKESKVVMICVNYFMKVLVNSTTDLICHFLLGKSELQEDKVGQCQQSLLAMH